jgi:hypothetical protein
MKGYVITTKEIEKLIPKIWSRISDYLGLNITWKDVLVKMEANAKKRGLKFVGFSISYNEKNKNWAFSTTDNIYSGNRPKYVYHQLEFKPFEKDKSVMKNHIAHELFHVYQNLFLYKRRYDLDPIWALKEAAADIVALKVIKDANYSRVYWKKDYYRNGIAMALAEKMNEMPRSELLKLITRPKSKKDVRALFNDVMYILSKSNYIKWGKKCKEV